MLTSKDRAKLKRLASTESAVYQIGKDVLNETNLNGICEALTARELIKINVLQNCDEVVKDLATVIAEKLNAEVVAVIGRKIILYKINPKNKKHILEIE